MAARVLAQLPLPRSAAALFLAPTIGEMATVILSASVDGATGHGLTHGLEDVARPS